MSSQFDHKPWMREMDACARALVGATYRLWPSFFASCESPLEHVFALAIIGRIDPCGVVGWPAIVGDGLSIGAQVTMEGYRVDYCVYRDDVPVLVVELDGFAFHERTPQDASKDRARDRLLLARGIPTVRFTGSQVFRDPESCLDEVLQLASSVASGQAVKTHPDASNDSVSDCERERLRLLDPACPFDEQVAILRRVEERARTRIGKAKEGAATT